MSLPEAADSLRLLLGVKLGDVPHKVDFTKSFLVVYVNELDAVHVPMDWEGHPIVIRDEPPEREDITAVTAIYVEAQKKLAEATDLGELAVDAVLELERAVVEAPLKLRRSVVPEAPCRWCGRGQSEHSLDEGHGWTARNEDR